MARKEFIATCVIEIDRAPIEEGAGLSNADLANRSEAGAIGALLLAGQQG